MEKEDLADNIYDVSVEPLRSKMTFRLQEPEAPFQNATSRDWQKAFKPQQELGAFCSGVMGNCQI